MRKQKTLSATLPMNRLKIEVEVTNHYTPPIFKRGFIRNFGISRRKAIKKPDQRMATCPEIKRYHPWKWREAFLKEKSTACLP